MTPVLQGSQQRFLTGPRLVPDGLQACLRLVHRLEHIARCQCLTQALTPSRIKPRLTFHKVTPHTPEATSLKARQPITQRLEFKLMHRPGDTTRIALHHMQAARNDRLDVLDVHAVVVFAKGRPRCHTPNPCQSEKGEDAQIGPAEIKLPTAQREARR